MSSFLSYTGMLILPGCVLLFAGGVARLRTVLVFLSLSKTATGEIVDAVHDRDANGKQVYLPIVEFQLLEKRRKIRFQAVVGSRWKSSVKIGETVGVRYLPEKPQIARINTIDHLYGDALGMIGAGAVFTLAAMFLLGKLF